MADVLPLARSVLGRHEKEAAVSEYLKNGGVNLDPATQAWCASFVNATLAQAGLPTAGEDAMSFKKYGEPMLGTPQPGDIGIFARKEDPEHTDWKGHAGFFTGNDEYGDPITIGGNVNDKVMEYPIDSNRLIGWRRPPGVKEPELPDIMSASVSPAVRKGMETVDFSRGGDLLDQRMSPAYSPVDTVGGTTTPLITGAYRKEREGDSGLSMLKKRFGRSS